MKSGDRAADYTHVQGAQGDWEQAYLRFETPAEEIRKFRRRLVALGARAWPRESAVVELFCGRGSGLSALAELGFTRVRGVDRSAALVARYRGPGVCLVADCRELPLASASQDIAVVQGGLHHLENLASDLERTLAEVHRVLRPEGLLVVVEPWLTPFLRAVHMIARRPLACRAWPRMEALSTMIRLEGATYERWLARPEWILATLAKHFAPRRSEARWGKLMFVGNPRPYDAG
jgi:SAM-dependent methyltransferase